MTRRDGIVVAVIVALALVAGYWLLLLAPKRQEAAALGTQLSQETQRLQTAQTAIASGLAARRSYGSNYAAVAQLGEAVPSDDNVPSLVYQLDAAARAAHVDFRAVKLAQGAGGAATSAPKPSTSPSPGTAAAAQSATATLPPGASVGPAGFPTMPFALTFDGSFFHMGDFFRRLDSFVNARNRQVAVGGRLLTVEGFALTAGSRGFPSVKASVATTAYLLPPTQGLSGGASPTSPSSAGGSTQAASSSGSSSAAPAPATATPPVR